MVYQILACELNKVQSWDFDKLVAQIRKGKADEHLYKVRELVSWLCSLDGVAEALEDAIQDREEALEADEEIPEDDEDDYEE